MHSHFAEKRGASVDNDQSRPYVGGPANTKKDASEAASLLALQDFAPRGLPVPVDALIQLRLAVYARPQVLEVRFPSLNPVPEFRAPGAAA